MQLGGGARRTRLCRGGERGTEWASPSQCGPAPPRRAAELQCRKHSHCFSASACDFQRLPTSTGILRGPDQPAGQTLLRADGLVFLGARGRWDRRSGREASPVPMDVYLGTWGLGGPCWGQETRLPPPGTWQATPCLVSTGHRTDPGLRGQPPAWGSLGPTSGQGSHPGRRQLSGAGEGVVLQGRRSSSSSQERVRAQGHQCATQQGTGGSGSLMEPARDHGPPP